MAKRKWQKQTFTLPENHEWKAPPGYNVFVADRGAVRFNVPRGWIVEPTDTGSVKFHDRQPPDDDCLLEMSVIRTHPAMDLTGAPLDRFVLDIMKDSERPLQWCGKVFKLRRPPLEVAWTQADFHDDAQDGRLARTRWLLARSANVVPFITIDYWVDDAQRVEPVWDELLVSLRVADYNIKMAGTDPRHWPKL